MRLDPTLVPFSRILIPLHEDSIQHRDDYRFVRLDRYAMPIARHPSPIAPDYFSREALLDSLRFDVAHLKVSFHGRDFVFQKFVTIAKHRGVALGLAEKIEVARHLRFVASRSRIRKERYPA